MGRVGVLDLGYTTYLWFNSLIVHCRTCVLLLAMSRELRIDALELAELTIANHRQ